MRMACTIAAMLVFAAVPAAAVDTYQCRFEDEQDGTHAILEQHYFGPDAPILPARQRVWAEAGGIHFGADSGPIRPLRDEPFELPVEISLGIELPARPATRQVTLNAPGVAPIRLRGHVWPSSTQTPGAIFYVRGRDRISALFRIRDWTALFRDSDGGVQFVVPFSMPANLETMRALHDRQRLRMREAARDPVRNCTHLLEDTIEEII